MKKRGFTLIELLAVIVILAIIALIATPIVMNVIENSKKGSAERSIENLEKAAELYYYENKLEGGFPGITFTCKNGSCSSNDKVLQINGKIPEAGSVKIYKDGSISLSSIVISGYNCYKENEKYKCDKLTKTTGETTTGILTLDSKTTELSNYRIYGNFKKKGLNLYHTMTFTDGYNLSTTGTIVEKANYKISDYLEVEPNETYISKTKNNYNDSKGTTISCWSYDENKNPIEMLFSNIRFSEGIYKEEFKIPENAKYIRISYGITDTDIEFYKKNPAVGENSRMDSVGNNVSIDNKVKYEIPIKVIGKNLFDENYFNKTNNYTTNSNGGYYSAIIKLKPNTTYTIISKRTEETETPVKGFHCKVASSSNVGSSKLLASYDASTNKFRPENERNITTGSEGIIYFAVSGHGSQDNLDSLFKYYYFQIVEGTTVPEYEPYIEQNYSIYLDEPLRCVDDVCDYIDFKSGKVVRYVKLESDGTLVKLKESISQDIDLPNININKGISNIFVETDITPSKVEVEYYK